MTEQVVAVIGAGGTGLAIARRIGPGNHVLMADSNQQALKAATRQLESAQFGKRG